MNLGHIFRSQDAECRNTSVLSGNINLVGMVCPALGCLHCWGSKLWVA